MSTILVLGGTGKTGRRIAPRLRAAGATVRTAARKNADVRFDWHDPSTYDAALAGAAAVYVVAPDFDLGYVGYAVQLFDRSEAAGVRHVTFLSARGVELAPPENAHRAVELELGRRTAFTHSILRPGWFMQDFDEFFFAPTIVSDGIVVAPTGDGAEAFIHADDIADVAAATLLDPDAHAGAEYTLAGPEALSFAQVAEKITAASGRAVRHVDPSPEAWRDDLMANGVPADYAQLLADLTGLIRASANGPTDDVERVTGRPPRSFDAYAAERNVVAAWTAASAPAPA
ncbi:NAD(P)H-binding protein [Solirubrobacter sp. CPCC 204708]|uniref:NAD(P)H-binding protein n=1 Tax=Solirubrobacter deserti TaxID=2282478 RepID=A0ABT4RCG2_9ACTN|nr:NAD(P)H-binding protein [Solirubrobacter deserti]MBE2315590.1 NAD(P)H-binding protein [Solirubrobacter deserti]MDA0136230.1 NAD(P)H-binding protein [Solirubrobacter deserti]